MKAIVNTGPGKLEWLELPLPEPGPGELRIKTAAIGICATDLDMIAGWERTGFPAVPGHEWSGVVDAAGSQADHDLIGTRCVAENVLADGGEVGFEHPGAYAQYFVTEASRIHPLPESLAAPTAILIEPLAVNVRAINRLQIRDKRAALVFGDGPIGLLMLMLLIRTGVKETVLVGGRPAGLALAKTLGASGVINFREAGDLTAAIQALGRMNFPNVIECSGSAAAIETSLNIAEREGKILIVGDYAEARAAFRWNHLLHRELELLGTNASAGAWAEAVWLAGSGELPLDRLITHRLPAAQYQKGIDLTRAKSDGVIKVVLEWD